MAADIQSRLSEALAVYTERDPRLADLVARSADLSARVCVELDGLAGGAAPVESLLLAAVVCQFDLAADVIAQLCGVHPGNIPLSALAEIGPAIRELLGAASTTASDARNGQSPHLRILHGLAPANEIGPNTRQASRGPEH